MALVSDVLTYARQIAQTDSNGISDTLGLAFSNDALQNITREMIARNIDASQIQESYANMNTNTPSSYAWPSDMFALKTIELDYTGTGGQSYIQAQPVETANLQFKTSFDYLRVNQTTDQPLYKNYGDTFEIFPVPASPWNQGMRIQYYLAPTEYTSTGSTIAYPQSLDYRCIAARVASLYALSQNQDPTLYENEYQKRLQDIIRILAPASQQPIQPQKLRVTGWEF